MVETDPSIAATTAARGRCGSILVTAVAMASILLIASGTVKSLR
jgi:hypothetical protein